MKTYMLLMLVSIFVFVSYLPVSRKQSRDVEPRAAQRIDSSQLADLRLDHFEVGSIWSREERERGASKQRGVNK
jgi:hypothetical protein